ncbi:MAG: cation acetate symporter [Limisphaerales bacterium]
MNIDPWILAFSALTVIATIWMGFWSAKRSRSASDFFVAGRSVSVGWNASAISGEYLSAASFMGIAGMVMSSGFDALWYPVCYACGYLFLLLFIAGPLRRFGAYTIPDFAEGRYDSPVFRKIAVIFVLFIGFFYTMPQMKGAGVTLAYIFPGLPYWVGVVLVGAVITLNVALGGMKGITLVQAFQYWLKMFAISVPIFVLMAVYGGYGQQVGMNKARTPHPETVPAYSVMEGTLREPLPDKAPRDPVWLNPFGPLTTKAARAAGLEGDAARRLALLYTYSLIIALVCGTAGLPHILVRFYTNPDGVAAKRTTMWVMILIGVFYVFPPVFGVMGRNLMPSLYEGTGAKGTDKVVLELPRILNERGAQASGVPSGASRGGSPSTNPDSVPLESGATPDSARGTRALPAGLPWGSILSGITCAGAFAAFMSTFSGLLVSMTGALAHDVYGRMLRPQSTPEQRMRMFKWCAVLIGAVAVLLGSFVEPLQINFMVGQAFAIAAASYFPLLFMSVWWRGMTMKGAATGMLAGGVSALAAVTITNFSDLGWLPLKDFWAAHPLLRILCEQPAIWTVPLAIGLMIVVSWLTRRSVPADSRMKMLVLHAPEALGLKQEYIREHEGH